MLKKRKKIHSQRKVNLKTQRMKEVRMLRSRERNRLLNTQRSKPPMKLDTVPDSY